MTDIRGILSFRGIKVNPGLILSFEFVVEAVHTLLHFSRFDMPKALGNFQNAEKFLPFLYPRRLGGTEEEVPELTTILNSRFTGRDFQGMIEDMKKIIAYAVALGLILLCAFDLKEAFPLLMFWATAEGGFSRYLRVVNIKTRKRIFKNLKASFFLDFIIQAGVLFLTALIFLTILAVKESFLLALLVSGFVLIAAVQGMLLTQYRRHKNIGSSMSLEDAAYLLIPSGLEAGGVLLCFGIYFLPLPYLAILALGVLFSGLGYLLGQYKVSIFTAIARRATFRQSP